MKDEELFKIWKNNNEEENRVYEKYKYKYEKLVVKQSNDIFAKIKKNVLLELVSAIIIPFVYFAICLYVSKEKGITLFMWFSIILFFMTSIIGVVIYSKYLRDIKLINEVSIIESLKKKQVILSKYIKRLKIILIVSLPIMFYVGVYFGVTILRGKELSSYTSALKLIVFSVPFLVFSIWSSSRIVHVFYGKHLQSIREIYNNLLEEDY